MRYIDADKLIHRLEDTAITHVSQWIKAEIINAPTADVRENVRGDWIHISDGYCDFLKCSQCGKATDSKSDYCPNCGADMKGGNQ